MMSQSDCARRFEEGATSGRASNVHIAELSGGWTALVGYGWAVYAVRDNSGTIHAYPDWHGYSQATACQLTAMNLSRAADTSHPEGEYSPRFDVAHEGRPPLRDFDVSALDDAPARWDH